MEDLKDRCCELFNKFCFKRQFRYYNIVDKLKAVYGCVTGALEQKQTFVYDVDYERRRKE